MTLLGQRPARLRHAELRGSFNAEHIMGMAGVAKRRWTAADVRALMDAHRAWPRYELLDGELLVTPSPEWHHQLAVGAMHVRLAPYCEHERLGAALMSPADIQLAPESIMQPDVFVVPEALIPAEETRGWGHVHWLLLAAEVLSPTTQREDRVRKRDFYLANGVREYWIVDLSARVLERWTPEQTTPELHRDRIVWHPAGARSPLAIDLEDYFLRGCRLPRRL